MEELFARLDRLSREPDDDERRAEVLDRVDAVEVPTPLGLDEAEWWRIRRQARTVADAIDHHATDDVLTGETIALRDLLKKLL